MNNSRRHFLRQTMGAGLATTTLGSSILQLGAMGSASAANISNSSDYRALVCVLLAGGNDSYNMLVPYDEESYNEYKTTRTDLALKKDTLLPLSNTLKDGRQLALHPSMPEIQQLYQQNKVAFISNIGTLIEPINTFNFDENTTKVPLGLFSHADQISQWQTAQPDKRSTTGWGGRLADLVSNLNSSDKVSMNISLSGSNIFQAGNNTVSYSIGTNGSIGLSGIENNNSFSALQKQGIEEIFSSQYDNIYRKAYANKFNFSLSANEFFSTATQDSIDFTTPFSNNDFSQQLQMVAKTIAARSNLGAQRQTFYVVLEGWDHHDEVLENQKALLATLSKGLNEFNAATEQLGVNDQVTTFTISDFARTLTSNGRGSDHGWGGNVMVMGGTVKGGNVYGEYPTLALNSSLDIGRGVLIPSLSVDQYFADLAMWFGVSTSDLPDILPNLSRFYNNNGKAPIGFMSS